LIVHSVFRETDWRHAVDWRARQRGTDLNVAARLDFFGARRAVAYSERDDHP